MKHEANYNVTVQGRSFLLTRSQIEFDSPNYFTTCFLGDFEESKTLHLHLSRDPDLFRIISDYLCGYTVLPLSGHVIPARMSPALALVNLKADAAFYQLDGLVEQCDALISPAKISLGPQNRYLVVGSEYEHTLKESFESQMRSAIKASTWKTRVTAERLAQEPLVRMKRPETHVGFEGLNIIAQIEHFARAVQREEPRLVGWHIEPAPNTNPYGCLRSRIMVVLAI